MKRVIIADDSATARMIIRRCLEIAGLNDAEFIEAENGRAALDLLRENPPDLLVSDITMPEMDGVELLQNVMDHEETAGVPVLIITSAKNSAKEKELLDIGAAAVLGKPVTPAEFLDVLDDLGMREEAPSW